MFRFTIRDVLWLMVVAGMGCGWWVERSSKPAKITELQNFRYDLVNAAAERGLEFVKMPDGWVLRDKRDDLEPDR